MDSLQVTPSLKECLQPSLYFYTSSKPFLIYSPKGSFLGLGISAGY